MQEVILEAGRAERHYWFELWQYRELCRVLAWRDVPVRYKQTVIGAAWALIRPFLTMVVFTVIFGKLANLPSDGVALQNSRSIEDARAWKRAFGMLPIPRGIYRFRTHEEADEWLWQMLTRRH